MRYYTRTGDVGHYNAYTAVLSPHIAVLMQLHQENNIILFWAFWTFKSAKRQKSQKSQRLFFLLRLFFCLFCLSVVGDFLRYSPLFVLFA